MKSYLLKLSLVGLIVGILLLSYLRETVFILINAKMAQTTHNYAHTAIPEYFNSLNYAQLRMCKWLFSIGFSAAFIGLTVWIIWLSFHSKRLIQISVLIYVFLIAEALGCVMIRHYFSLSKTGYLFLHFGENLLQSPLVLMGMVALYYLQVQIEKQTG